MSFASPWESMLAQMGQDGLRFAQAIPALQGNAVFAAAGGPFQDLVRRLEFFKQKVATQDAFLRSGVKENFSMAINRLEVALLQLYKLAVFIRGESGGDDMQKMSILEQCFRAFSDSQAASQAGFDQVQSIYSQAVSLNAEEIQQLQREVERASEQTKMDWENGRRQMEQCQEDVARYSRQLEDASNAFREAHDNARDIGNDIGRVFFPFGGAFGDMENNQRRVEEARHRVNAAQDQLQNAHYALMQVVSQQNELNMRRAAIDQVAQQLPVLQATADALNKQSAALLAGFTELREKATQLALLMNDMRNGARDTGAQSWDKDRFAEGILRLCQMALIDGRVCDEVETITNEISSGYTGQVPGSVADLLAKVGQLARDVAQKSISG
ncbi:hypothetical protein FVEG_10769 [Fusarium verticillioides 7600]|uniref:Uncharacterized protein n=1 Tax=Gibberella moniliformis (strain M3125 / FGSC 7600) TaxID=334819 RepID=W7MKL5_GIBM7|nr:hypothetical protein FVEG_10769 [Fusarium verticillioides 7600]EWG51918.1 hypothetical protein FVEG_10769 [Fusarium verticillioides 7600]RBQ84607.1 hypothetical protein FVER53263_10769 [Fusarium verticillioides]RBR22481.1 hypothetical protein FVER53590_10769 [Fusarium verticillioides]